MNKLEDNKIDISYLTKKLDELGIPKRRYTINGNLQSDICVLNEVHGKWEYFYFDERGGRNDYRQFNSESEDCEFFYEVLKNEI